MKRALSTLTVATLALLGGLPLPGPRRAAAQPADATDYFYAQDRKVGVTLVLDQLGVAARDGVDRRRIEAALAQFELRLVQEHPQGIFFFRLPRALPRPDLVRLARRVREQAGEILAYVGFPATPEGAKVPLIVTDELIAKAKPEGRERMLALGQELGLEVAGPDRFVKDQYLLRVKPDARLDALEAANRLQESGAAEFAHPNFVRVIDYRQFVPNDTLFGNQWHHQNTAQGAGTVDADADTTFAWTITQGAAGTVVAVIDDGFDIGHADLTPNLWVNAGEVAGNNVDDEGNGFTDDVNGFDFGGNDGNPSPAASNNHGTAVAGVAAARGNNSLGVAGACPNCGLMVVRQGVTVQADANSFGYAQQMGAAVITNSWGYTIGTPTTTAVVNAINAAATAGRGGLGSIVLFAMNNGNINDCTGATPDISSIANVIAVSASSNQDRKVTESAFGNCMDVLAPTHRGYGGATPFSGTLNITTTDRTGNAGYNNTNPIGAACPSTEPAAPPANARDYTLCFGGTSSATPLTAGVAGLVLTARGGLTRLQVQQLLQDTADKMQDSVGAYASASGFSAPGSGTASHGWGRINAFEAVRVAGPAAQGGRAGVDVFIRDNRLDWGNTEQPSNTLFEPTRGFIPHWQSVDIKVDAPPYQPAPTTNAAFEAFTHENPESGDLNKVYVRVRNRGPVTATSVGVKLHWAFAGAGLPALPNDFWTAFPADSATTTVWHPLGTQTAANLAYSGSSAANTAGDAAQIVAFDFTGPALDPSQPNPDHFCLFAVLDSSQDRAQPKSRPTVAADFVPDQLTPTDNNVTHRNVSVVDAVRNRSSRARFFVHNPTERVVKSVLRVQAPRGWQFAVEGVPLGQSFTLKAHERRLVTVQISSPREGAVGDVDVVQEIRFGRVLIKGGTTYRFEVPARSNDPQP